MIPDTDTFRVNTGTHQPKGRLYPGVFIAGDDALYRYLPALRAHLRGETAPWTREALNELARILADCQTEM